MKKKFAALIQNMRTCVFGISTLNIRVTSVIKNMEAILGCEVKWHLLLGGIS